MKRMIMLVLCLLMTVPALAEKPALRSATLNGTGNIVAIDDAVYCMTSTQGWRAETTIFCLTKESLTPVWRGRGSGFSLYEMDGQLLLTATEMTFLQDLTGAGGTWAVTRIDPATWEAERLLTTGGGGRIVCVNGALCWFEFEGSQHGENDLTHTRLLRWDGAAWETILDWTGEPSVLDRWGSYLYPNFVLLETREISRDTKDVTLSLLDSGERVTLHDVRLYGSDMVLTDGELYTLGRDGIYAHDLASDASRKILTVPERQTYSFCVDDTRLVGMPADGCVSVYDRSDMTLLRTIRLPSGALDWLLLGDMLYAFEPTSQTSAAGGRVISYEPAFCAAANIATGECWTLLLDGKD